MADIYLVIKEACCDRESVIGVAKTLEGAVKVLKDYDAAAGKDMNDHIEIIKAHPKHYPEGLEAEISYGLSVKANVFSDLAYFRINRTELHE